MIVDISARRADSSHSFVTGNAKALLDGEAMSIGIQMDTEQNRTEQNRIQTYLDLTIHINCLRQYPRCRLIAFKQINKSASAINQVNSNFDTYILINRYRFLRITIASICLLF